MQNQRSVEIGKFEVNLEGLVLPLGLRVQSVRLTGQGLTLTHEPFSSKGDQPGRLQVYVAVGDIAAFLNATSPAGLKNVTVEAKEDLLHINATKTVLIDVKAQATCSLRIVDKSKLYVDLKSIDVMGAGPKQLIQSQLDKINPVIDAADFPVRATLDTVEIVAGGILLQGSVDPNHIA